MTKVMSRAVLVLLVLGVVIGVWRVLGGGADITDPAWPKNAYNNLIDWASQIEDIIPGATPTSTPPQT